jgi:hypothetical protein
MYGQDNYKRGNLTKQEKGDIMSDKWTQIIWQFNQFHSIHHSDYPEDICSYSVEITNKGKEGLIVTIHQFKEVLLNALTSNLIKKKE